MSRGIETMISNSERIAGRSNGNTIGAGDLYYKSIDLYRHPNGKWFTVEHGGPAMGVDRMPHWLDRTQAIEWIASEARDPVTDYGYSWEQAEIMVDGGDAGRGYRD